MSMEVFENQVMRLKQQPFTRFGCRARLIAWGNRPKQFAGIGSKKLERLFLTWIYAEGFGARAFKSRTICVAVVFVASLWMLGVSFEKIALIAICATFIRRAPISVSLIETAAVAIFLLAVYQELRIPLGSFALAAVP